jgi:hypothetical protein
MRRYQRGLAALHVIGLLIFLSAPSFSQDLPVDIVREKSLHSKNVVEESRITIKQSWDHPDWGKLRTGTDVYRAAPALVPGSSWLAYVSQSAIGSWIGSYAPMAFQTIDR